MAVTWYRQAAEQGHTEAQIMLGIAYENGLGVDKDTSEAVVWYRRAAANGYADAQFEMGRLEENLTKAAAYYRKVAGR
jgi:TPR repeat protein